MKRGLFWLATFTALVLGSVSFAQDKMIIFFKDGRKVSIDLDSIQKIEYTVESLGTKGTYPLGAGELPAPSGMVGWWAGDENARDKKGNRHGTLRGGASYGTGLFGSAFLLDGKEGYVDLGNWSPGPKWTIEAWVNPLSVPSGRKTIAGGMNECRDWGLVMQNGTFGLAIRPPGACTDTISSGVRAKEGKWYHIVGVCDGSTARIYINGELKGTGTVERNYVGTSIGIRIGGESCCAGNNFAGLVDEMRIYSRDLTPQEIKEIFRKGSER